MAWESRRTEGRESDRNFIRINGQIFHNLVKTNLHIQRLSKPQTGYIQIKSCLGTI